MDAIFASTTNKVKISPKEYGFVALQPGVKTKYYTSYGADESGYPTHVYTM